MNRNLSIFIICTLLIVACIPTLASQPKSGILTALEEELARNMRELKERTKQPPYFISYNVTDRESIIVSASRGALQTSNANRQRVLDVDVRVGSYEQDNTSQIRDENDFSADASFVRSVPLPLDDDRDAIKSALWLETDRRYKAATERLIKVAANRNVRVEAADTSPDFSREQSAQVSLSNVKLNVNKEVFEGRVKNLSRYFNAFPDIFDATVTFTADATTDTLATTEGTSLEHAAARYRISVLAQTKAADGMDLYRFESFDAHDTKGLPDDASITRSMEKMARDLLALRKAPVITPFAGPAILSGRASGVFFHEIFGHRIEGHRQKSENEGQTFTASVGSSVLPAFLSVYDDPTIRRLSDVDLNGFYEYDDEGVKARRVGVVERGVLRNFLMSRAPITGFPKSNGHGRKAAGFRAVGRQGNLIVEATRGVSERELRRLLIQECRKQGKPYGLLFEDISGGFTFTTRDAPQSFQVTPILVYRVYVDGRADELVRGADLIGTPLTAFSRIIAAGDTQQIFNGYCGAESGFIPVSAISPSILVSQIEVQKQQKSSERLPVLPPPDLSRIGN